MESWTGEQYLQLPESGSQLWQFLAYPDLSRGPWQKQAVGGFNKMPDAVVWPWSTLSVADNAGKRGQKCADRQNDVRDGRSKPGWSGGDSATDSFQRINEQDGSAKGSTSRL